MTVIKPMGARGHDGVVAKGDAQARSHRFGRRARHVELRPRSGNLERPQRRRAHARARGRSHRREGVGVHVTQLRRYEAGTSQPTLDVVRELARALRVSADALVFDPDERGPDDDFRLHFEALSQLDDDERNVIKSVLDGLLLKHEAKRWTAPAPRSAHRRATAGAK